MRFIFSHHPVNEGKGIARYKLETRMWTPAIQPASIRLPLIDFSTNSSPLVVGLLGAQKGPSPIYVFPSTLPTAPPSFSHW